MKKILLISAALLISLSIFAQNSDTDFIDFQISKYAEKKTNNTFNLKDYKTDTYFSGRQSGNMASISMGGFDGEEWEDTYFEYTELIAYFADNKLIKMEISITELTFATLYIKNGAIIYNPHKEDVDIDNAKELIPIIQAIYDYQFTEKYTPAILK